MSGLLLLLLLGGLVAAAWGLGREWAPGHRIPGPGRPSVGRRRPAGARRRWPGWPGRGPAVSRPPELGVLVAEVASRLRAGATPEAAWTSSLNRVLGDGVVREGAGGGLAHGAGGGPGDPAVDQDTAWRPPPALAHLVHRYGRAPAAATAVHTVVIASRLTHVLGAPLAEVLDHCAATITEAEQAHDARRVALAGPRTTARILAGLPLLGLLLGAGLGADPLAVAVDGGWGTLSVLLGAVLMVAGRRWTAALVAAAEGTAAERTGKRHTARPRP